MNHAQFAIGQTNAPANAAADVNGKVTALFPQQSDDAVDSALDMFNRMSRQITDSYRTLWNLALTSFPANYRKRVCSASKSWRKKNNLPTSSPRC